MSISRVLFTVSERDSLTIHLCCLADCWSHVDFGRIMLRIFRDGSDEPPLRYSNISYDANTQFCHTRSADAGGKRRYVPPQITRICVLPQRLEPNEIELCRGEITFIIIRLDFINASL